MYYSTKYLSPIAKIILMCDGENLVGLWLRNQKYTVEESISKDDLKIFRDTKRWFDRYFAGEKPNIFELQLKPEGGQFRQEEIK